MNQVVPVVDEGASQWVTFKLDDETYGLNVLQVQEVLRVSEITPVPGAPDFVLGIINLRGKVVTVIDGRRRFKLEPREADEESRIVIMEAGEQVLGILVDSVAEVVTLTAGEVEDGATMGSGETAKFIRGACHRDGELLLLVELQELIHDAAPVARDVARLAGPSDAPA